MKNCIIAVAYFALIAAVVLVALPSANCNAQINNNAKVVDVQEVTLSNGTAQAVMTFQKNGKPIAISIRADHGIIVCSHFSLEILQKHDIVAASVQGVKSITEALQTKVVHVNQLAEKLGIEPGVTVLEALERMNQGSE